MKPSNESTLSASRPNASRLNESSLALQNSKQVPQFSPNFSVYLVPPESVCLYSENRKFFLHGALYCRLAEAIAKGGRNCRDLVRDLKHEFPADKIEEALKRLFDRRYVVPASRNSAGITAAWWTSLGLPLHAADANLQKCRVRVQTVGVQGGAELSAALRQLGVRVVDRSPDLTVTVVGDYMEGRLAQLNEQHLQDRTPWLLVQPSGMVPLVGPVFTPGKGACWVCLADRMRRNREIKGMLDREQARCLVASPLSQEPLGQAGIGLAAVEIAKAIATEFRTELSDHILSLDLSGAAIVKHYVAARPQCAVCGDKKQRNSRRAAVPIDLGASGKLVMTSGGYRSVSSRATVARFRKHVSPLTGVVSRLERIDADLPLNTNFIAAHNFSAPARSVNQLRAGLGGGSFGKGSTAEQGEASALMEAIERYSGIFQGDEIRVTKRFTDFQVGEAILPNDVLLYSDAQQTGHRVSACGADHSHGDHAHTHHAHTDHAHTDHGHGDHSDGDQSPPAPAPFDRSATIEWSPVWSLRDERFRYLPTGLLYFFYGQGFTADSNGCAAGNTVGEAIVQGFLELVERDAYAIWWYNRLQRREVDLSQFDDSYIRDLQVQFAEAGRRLWVLDVTSDLGIPTFVAITHWVKDGKENIEFGSGAHFDARIALLRALTELNQFLALGLMGGGTGDKSSLDGTTPLRLDNYPYLTPTGDPAIRVSSDSKFGRLDVHEQVKACVNIARQQGLDFLVLDQTRADIEVPVVRVIVPGLRHFYRRFGPGRLYDVPIKLGLRDRPMPEDELNPIHPHT
jgi:oxazoline/thiazoline synthase